MFGEAPSDRIRKVYAAASFAEKEEFQRILEEKGLDSHSDKVEIVDDKVFKNLSDTVTPQGVLCLISMKNWSLSKMLEDADKPLFMILEDLQDPGNLGTIIRTGEGAGVTGVILSKTSVDVFNPKVIRSTMGSVYRVPVLYVDSIEEEVLPMLKTHGITTYAAHLKGENNYDQEDYGKGDSVFLLGMRGMVSVMN